MFVPKRRSTRYHRMFRRTRSGDDPRELYTPIHPIFRRKNWIDISDDEYKLLDPGLRLASCFLYEPSVMPFFTGILRREFTKITNVPQAVTEKFMLNRFDPIPYTSDKGWKQQTATWKTLANMKDCISWRFNYEYPLAWAASMPTKTGGHYAGGLKGFAAVTSGTIVSIDKDFLNVLKGNIRLDHFPKSGSFDPDAAKLRTSWFMASVLCHEFCHALWFATWNFGDKSGPLKLHDEPFFQDQRVAELGAAFETHLFGIKVDPLGKNSKIATNMQPRASIAAPYGIQAVRWPGATPQQGANPEPALATPAHWGARDFYLYPLPTSSVHR
ncbi:hypothetical protein BDV97DRAFT_418461 [Delphinella strobiligena]|nr:hypothetical protein BDV97DRAFT_418461 [Delphinella strobiligena]